MPPPKDPCKPFACAIQKCLEERNYQETACQDQIKALRECCKKWKEESLVCSGIDVEEIKEDEFKRTSL